MEYVVLMVAVITTVVAMRTYLRYSLQGRLNDARWTLLEQSAPFDPNSSPTSTWQYDLNSTETSEGVPRDQSTTTGLLGLSTRRHLTFFVDTDFDETTTMRRTN